MSNEISLLNDAELEAVSGGIINTSFDGIFGSNSTPRERTSAG